jgi:endonuclease/exonuclease/phosphatase (EEP) superfamily protein YafD
MDAAAQKLLLDPPCKASGPRTDLIGLAANGVVVFVLVASLVRGLLADRVDGLSALFYATPPIATGGLLLLCAIFWLRRGRSKRAAGLGLAGLLLACWWHANTFRSQPKTAGPAAGLLPVAHAASESGRRARPLDADSSDASARVVFWNVARGALSWSGVIDQLASFDADLIGLGECVFRSAIDSDEFSLRLPGRHSYYGPASELMLISHHPINVEHAGRVGSDGHYLALATQLVGQPVAVVLVDLHSNPFRPRERALRVLRQLVDGLGERPVILMGDFNTPLDSVHWRELRPALTHAFEAGGQGYAVSWPQPLAVMMLDHVWVGGGLTVRDCRLPWTLHSDHRPVVVEVSVGNAGSR